MYKRKTKDEYNVMADYGYGLEVVTTEETFKEARQRLKEYKENDTYAKDLKIKKTRVKLYV